MLDRGMAGVGALAHPSTCLGTDVHFIVKSTHSKEMGDIRQAQPHFSDAFKPLEVQVWHHLEKAVPVPVPG